MKKVFTLDGLVIGHAKIFDHVAGKAESGNPNSIDFDVDDSVATNIGWAVSVDAGGNPTFAPYVEPAKKKVGAKNE